MLVLYVYFSFLCPYDSGTRELTGIPNMPHSVIVNPSMPNAFPHSYQLDDFFLILVMLGGIYLIFKVLKGASVSKQWRT